MSEINAVCKVRGISQEKLLLKAEPQTPEEEDDHEIINVTDGNTGVILSKPQVVMSTTTLITAAHSTTQSP